MNALSVCWVEVRGGPTELGANSATTNTQFSKRAENAMLQSLREKAREGGGTISYV